MSQDIRLYGLTQVWDQPLQAGQRNLLQAIMDFWPAGIDSVLDVGCGDGKLTRRLQERGPVTLVGLDSSAQALSRLPFAGVIGDAQALPFAPSSFDLVMSTDALEHMPDEQEAAAWQELFRVAEKVVMVAVPFREELLDATACCAVCGHHYHVNWHQRSYDMADLHRHCPTDWRIAATVLAGEPWSPMLAPETQLRRRTLNEWAGWELAICPACGTSGQAAPILKPLPSLFAQVLAEQIYPALGRHRHCRSHSEILVIFERKTADVSYPPPRLIEPRWQAASRLSFVEQRATVDLHPFCQVAQHVAVENEQWRIQFPLYEQTPVLHVSRVPGSKGALHMVLEDELGCLLGGCVLADGEPCRVHQLPRVPVAGYYGVLASCPVSEPFACLQLGEAPSVLWAEIADEQACGYLQLNGETGSVFVQVTQPLWFDPQILTQEVASTGPSPKDVLDGLQARFKRVTEAATPMLANTEQTAELDRLHIQVQSLTAGNHALRQRAVEADRLALQVHDLTTERDALRDYVAQADQRLTDLQTLTVKRDVLRERVLEIAQLKAADREASSTQFQAAMLESAHRYNALHQQYSTLQASLQEVQRQVVEALEEKQQLHDELLVHQTRSRALSNRLENRVGAAIRETMANLITGKK